MSFLDRVRHGKRALPRRCLCHGGEGIGKSTFASEAPSPIFLATEDGSDDIDTSSGQLLTSYAEVMEAIGELYEKPHDYQTAVIDSLDWLEPLIWAEAATRAKLQSIDDLKFNEGRRCLAPPVWRELLAGLQALRMRRNMHIILIAHSKSERVESPETDSYDRFAPKLDKHANGIVLEWCDEILFATTKVLTKAIDEGFGKTRHRAISKGDRVLKTTPSPSYLAKNRLGLPDELPLVRGESWMAYSYFFTSSAGPAAASTDPVTTEE